MSRSQLRRAGQWAGLSSLILLLMSTPAISRAVEVDSLESRLRPLIEAHKGKVGLAVKNLKTGEAFAYQGDEPMPTASLIKFPVMVEAYRQVAEGKVDLNQMVVLEESDKVPGSGILTDHFSPGATFSLRDAIRLMMAYSDNTATNLVLDEIGLGSTNDLMEELGYPNTKIHAKVYRRDTSIAPERSQQFGLGSTTASEMIRLCEALDRHELGDSEACEAMIEHMRACQSKNKFSRFLPASAKLAFKGGSVNAARTAAGLFETPAGTVALCVLTAENEDQRWVRDNAGNRLCAEIAREVYRYFRDQAGAPESDEQPASESTDD